MSSIGVRSRKHPVVSGAAIPYMVWIAVFFLAPVSFLVASSFWTQNGVHIDRTFTVVNYATVLDPTSLELRILVRTYLLAIATSLLSLLIAFPFAYFVAKVVRREATKSKLLLPVFLPFLVSPLVVAVAWRGVLGTEGLVNVSLEAVRLIDRPLDFLLFSRFAVVLTLVYNYSLWMFFTLYLAFEALDDAIPAAARDLGASRWQVFRFVTVPLVTPGIVTGAVLTFVPVVGATLEPDLVGGTGGRLIGNSIRGWFLEGLDWPLGASIGVTVMVTTYGLLVLAMIIASRRLRRLLPT